MPPALHPLHAQVSSALQSRHHIPVDAQWLNDFLTSRGPNPPPLPALISTAHFRILASDITTSISPNSAATFPEDASDVTIRDRRLQDHVIVQVLDVHDVGSSKFSQIEAIERVERGEEIRGREVIRSVRVDHDGEDEDGAGVATSTTTTTNSNNAATATATATATTTTTSTNPPTKLKLTSGPHKLVVQDAKGTRMFALEVDKVPKLGVSVSAGAKLPPPAGTGTGTSSSGVSADDPGMFIGCKLLLQPGTVVRRGMIMLAPENCLVMGGKVEAWDKKWREGRKGRLVALLAEENSDSSSRANANANGVAAGG
ncbi:hypothetical protein G647_04462 [Cladophialophora carrionii CBS 160.54]|uniref:RecQ-mediated genome instability protein 1 n=1 Tax=Cladophialophora carrionii CBS 160.54 TaxID=1279043 RepID=V9DEI5_9EURO|nr:uncharacterized protein G647_04462 [Cladophialophora carrionii CBS 160.54]ETI25091.1 hypothetical protein G647_04462 [Cladophialophora carrionii CBS 160.54]